MTKHGLPAEFSLYRAFIRDQTILLGAVVQVSYATNSGSLVFAVKHLKDIKLPVPWNNAVSTWGTNPDR